MQLSHGLCLAQIVYELSVSNEKLEVCRWLGLILQAASF